MKSYWKSSIPDNTSGEVEIETFSIPAEIAQIYYLKGDKHIRAGSYKKLLINGQLVMSDTWKEFYDHLDFFQHAHGNVLINGLGLGCCLNVVLNKPGVKHVTVIEKSADVIALVAPYFPQVTIIHADALNWPLPKGPFFNTVWHDIWPDICADNYDEMKFLHRKYAKKCDWQGSWERKTTEQLIKQGKSYGQV